MKERKVKIKDIGSPYHGKTGKIVLDEDLGKFLVELTWRKELHRVSFYWFQVDSVE